MRKFKTIIVVIICWIFCITNCFAELNEQTLTKEQRISGLVQLWSAIKYKCAVLEYAEVDWDKILPETIDTKT